MEGGKILGREKTEMEAGRGKGRKKLRTKNENKLRISRTKLKQEILGKTNLVLSFDTTRTA
jgi:hypothetical protein